MNKVLHFAQQHFMIAIGAILVITVAASFAVSYNLSSQQSQVAATQSCEVDVCVDLTENGMQPGEIAVKTGQFVQFNTKDNRFHSLSLGSGSSHGTEDAHGDTNDKANSETDDHDEEHSHEHLGSLQSGKFGPGEAWKVQFTDKGTFVIHDHNFPEHSILVVVYDEQQ